MRKEDIHLKTSTQIPKCCNFLMSNLWETISKAAERSRRMSVAISLWSIGGCNEGCLCAVAGAKT